MLVKVSPVHNGKATTAASGAGFAERRCMILICGRLVLLFAGILSHAGLKSLVGGRFDWKLIHATSYLRHSLWFVMGSPFLLSAS
ncbi:unnamed protein product [Boreogadus saida]